MAEILSDKTKTLSAIIDGEGNNAESDMLSRLLDTLCQDEE
jgi:negative regulator of sigma E activity